MPRAVDWRITLIFLASFLSPALLLADTTPPSITDIALPGASPTNGTSVEFLVNFSERIASFDESKFSCRGFDSAVCGTKTVSQTNDTQIRVVFDGISGDGDIVLDVYSAAVADDFSNENNLFTQSTAYTIDQTAPVPTFTQPTGFFPVTTTSNNPEFLLTFNEPVQPIQVGDAVVSGTSNFPSALWGGFMEGNQAFRLSLLDFDGQGEVGLTIPASKIVDLAGNQADSEAYSSGYYIDNVAPSFTGFAALNRVNDLTYQVTANWDEAVQGLALGDIGVSFDRPELAIASSNLFQGLGQSSYVYQFTLQDQGGNPPEVLGNLNFSIPSGKVTDKAGNGASGAPSTAYQIDLEPPTVNVFAELGSYSQDDQFQWIVEFSEPMAGFEDSDLIETASGKTFEIPAYVEPITSSRYRVISASYAGSSPGSNAFFSVNAGSVTDLSGNSAPGFTSSTIQKVISVIPGVTQFSLLSPNPSSSSFRYGIEFNTPISTDASSLNAIVNRTGTLSSGDVSFTKVTDAYWTAEILNVSGNEGTVGFTIPSGLLSDYLLQFSTEAYSSPVYTVDRVAPTVSSFPPLTRTEGTNNYQQIIEFNEPVTGLLPNELNVFRSGNVAYSNLTVTQPTSSSFQISLNLNILDGQTNTVSIVINENALSDAAGNVYTEAISVPTSTIDQTPLALADVELTKTQVSNGNSAGYRIVFNKPIQSLLASGIIKETSEEITLDGIDSFLSFNNEFFYDSAIINGSGTFRLRISADKIIDIYGNRPTADIITPAYTFDKKWPYGAISSEVSSPYTGNTISWVITFNEPVTGVSIDDFDFTIVDLITGTPSLETISQTQYRMRLPITSGVGSAKFVHNVNPIIDHVGNTAIIAEAPLVERIEPTLQVGSYTVDVTNSSTITKLDFDSYLVSENAVLGNVVRFGTTINIDGSQITGNGLVFVGTRQLFSGSFTFDGTNGNLIPNASATETLTVSGVTVKPRKVIVRPSDVFIQGRFPQFPNLSFSGLVLTPGGGSSFSQPALVAEGTWSGNTNPEQVPISISESSVILEADGIRFSTPSISDSISNPRSISINELKLNGNGTVTSNGTFTLSGLPCTFTGLGFSTVGITFPTTMMNVDTDLNATFNNLLLADTFLTSSGGTINGTSLNATFFNPGFAADSIDLGTVSVPSVGPFGNATITQVNIVGIDGIEGIVAAENATLTISGVDFILDDSGTFGPEAFTAETASLYNVGSLNISIDLLNLTNSSFTAGGGFELASMNFNFAMRNENPGVRLQGGFSLPSNLIGASASADLTFINDQVIVNGVEFCTPEPVAIKKSKWTIPQLCFSYESGPPEVYEGSTTIGLENVVTIGAEARVANGNLDRIFASLSDLDKPIGNSGAFLQEVGAGLDKLARLEECVYTREDRYSRFVCSTPPVTLLGLLGISAGREIEGLDTYTFYIEADGKFFESGFDIEGPATLVSFPVGEGLVQGRWSGQDRGVRFGGSLGEAPLDHIKGRLDGFIDSSGNVNATGSVYQQIPSSVPVIGGKVIGGVQLNLSVTDQFRFTGRIEQQIPPAICIGDFASLGRDGRILGDIIPGAGPTIGETFEGAKEGIRRGTTIIVNGVETVVTALSEGCIPSVDVNVSIEISRSGVPSFSIGRSQQPRAPWESDLFAPIPLTDTTGRSQDQDPLFLHAFTNYDSAQKIYRRPVKTQPRTGGVLEAVELNEGKGTMIILRYENPTGIPAYTLQPPSGRLHTPERDYQENPIPDPNRRALYSANLETRDASWILGETEAGIYTLELSNASSLGNYSIEVVVANDDPTFEFTNAQINGSLLGLSWNDNDADDDASITLFLDTDNQGGDGFAIFSGLSEDDPTDMATLDLATTNIQTGWYWPYALIEDNRNSPKPIYAEAPIFIPDSEAPSIVQNLNVVTSGPQAVVTWNPVSDPDLLYYKVLYASDPASQLYDGTVTIQADESAAIINRLDQNEDYRFTVVAVRGTTTTPARRANDLRIVSNVASQLNKLSGARNRKDASKFVRGEMSSDRTLSESSRIDALATQAVEVAISNEIWANNDPRLLAEMGKRMGELSKRSYARIGTYSFSDGPILSSDEVVTSAPQGLNNNPRFITKPLKSIAAGFEFNWQAQAEDIDNDPVTFVKVSGPEALTVSTNGLVKLPTYVGIAGLETITIAAKDDRGGRTELTWELQIIPGASADSSHIKIVSAPITNAEPDSTYVYTPAIKVSTYNPPTWQLIEGPVAMAFSNSEYGSLVWEVPSDQTEPVRVRIRVTMNIAGKVGSDTQEWIILPEANDNAEITPIVGIEVRNDQIAVLHQGIHYDNANDHAIKVSYRQLTPTENPTIDLGTIAYDQGVSETLVSWPNPQDGEDYEITAQLSYSGQLRGEPLVFIYTAPEPPAPVEPKTITVAQASGNEQITLPLPIGPNVTLIFPMENGVTLKIIFENVTSSGFITVSRFEDTVGASEAGLNTSTLIPQRWVISSAGAIFQGATLEFIYEEGLLNGIDESLINFAYRVVSNSLMQTFAPPQTITDINSNSIRVEGVTGFSTWYFGSGPLLGIKLQDFQAEARTIGSGVDITWSTAAEINNAGFHLYRAITSGDEPIIGERLTDSLIPAMGDIIGVTYSFYDEVPLSSGEVRGYYLEDMEMDGDTSLHGPVYINPPRSASRIENWTILE